MIEQLVQELRRKVVDEIGNHVAHVESQGRPPPSEVDRRQMARAILQRELDVIDKARLRQGQVPPSRAERIDVIDAVMESVFQILPGLDRYLCRPDVTDIYAQGWDDVQVQLVDGTRHEVEPFAASDEEMIEMIRRIARRAGQLHGDTEAGGGIEKEFTPARPFLDLELSDGSRLAASAWVTKRPYLAIRRHVLVDVDLDELITRRMLDPGLASFLRAALWAHLNVMIAGPTGVGKTTLMRAVLHECHPEERVMVIEEEPELHLDASPQRHRHVLAWRSRPPNMEDRGAVDFGDLSRAIKRFNPDRIVVGEVRGPEVVDMLEAITSHSRGSICTIHADSSQSVLSRIATYAYRGKGTKLTATQINEQAAHAINLVVYLDHASDGRRAVAEVRQVVGYDPLGQTIVTNQLFVRGPDGAAVLNDKAPMPADLRAKLSAHGYNVALHARPNGVRR